MQRRQFIRKALWTGGLISLGQFPLSALESAHFTGEVARITLLHTNDVHSRMEPFPEGSRYAGMGGAARRAGLINQIRKEVSEVLLLDAGDMFQGTPYFNFYQGELELKAMSAMGYDAGTIGNHDFDAGIESLAKQLDAHAHFPLLNANYLLKDTPLSGKVAEYQIFQKGRIKVGVFGLGIELKGLVPEDWYGNTQYLDPVVQGQRVATLLRREMDCDLVICLSHLGYQYRGGKISDVALAQQTRDIDIIIGGHTHTFLDTPVLEKNLDGEDVLINQVGWAGIRLGRLDVHFVKGRKGKCVACKNMWIQ